ncbi:MAG TPA: DNA translocase FtsK [Dehalococcoidia bacterium]|nr:DNA translocase FtsK [Dehalococcoidia bacterium]
MARKRNAKKSGVPGKTAKNPGGGGFFRVLISTPVRQLIMTAVIVVLLAVFWEDIKNGLNSLVDLFGVGLAFIAIAIIILIVLIWKRALSTLLFSWYRWMGGITFVLAIWAILAFSPAIEGVFDHGLGGEFGRGLIVYSADSAALSAFCVVGFIILGIILMAPSESWQVVTGFFSWLYERFSRKTVPLRTPKESQQRRADMRPPATKPSLPDTTTRPVIAPEVSSSMKRLEDIAGHAATLKPARPDIMPIPQPRQSDLKQVAEEVWRKYGQSPNLVVVDGWKLPPIDILDVSPEVEFTDADNVQRAKLIEDSLASYGVEAKVVQINTGPTVTQFGVEPGWDRKYKEIKEKDENGNVQVRMDEVSKTRVKVERITSLANDMALALAAPSIRIEAPVPGKSIIGIEVPNTTSDMVSLRGVVETSPFQKSLAKSKLTLALGKGAGGEAVAADLIKMPHLLIAGATGSGKTVCLNTIICCILMHNTPNDVRFILIDPKRVELTQYNSIPHLATPVIVDTNKALNALRWLSQEMDQRYQKLAAEGARHIEGYNKNKECDEKLPYLVLIIDELADLMMAGFDEVESNLCRLAQLARATGIHLVVATQRPSVDVVTGLIKANFPTRMSFAVTSQVDSRTILDGAGAEKLLGRGDMLFMPTEAAKPKRLQGCFLSDSEIERLVYFWSSQQREQPDKLRLETLVATAPSGTIGGHPRDPLLEQAKELAKDSNISTSFLQRRLHIGYPRAARLMEQLEAELGREETTPNPENEV